MPKEQGGEIMTSNVIFNNIEELNKEEFFFLISTLPNQKLLDPFKRSKELSKEISGFRIDRVKSEKIQDIYYTHIYKKKDEKLLLHVKLLINDLVTEIKDKISEQIGDSEAIYKQLSEGNLEQIPILFELLQETSFKNNIFTFLKIINLRLSNEQERYLKENLVQFIDNYYSKQNEIHKKELKEAIRQQFKFKEMFEKSEEVLNEKKEELETLHFKINELIKTNETNSFYYKKENEKAKETADYLQNELENEKKLNIENNNKILELSLLIKGEFEELKKAALVEFNKRHQDLINENAEIESEIEFNLLEKKNIIEEINRLIGEKVDLNNSLVKIKEEAETLRNEQLWLSSEIDKLTSLQSNIENSLIVKIRNIKTNITEFFSDAILYQTLLGFNGHTYQTSSKSILLNRSNTTDIEDEVETISNVTDVIYFLELNLEVAGVHEEIINALSHYITACITYERPLLLVGYGARNIADAISYTVCGKRADIIALRNDSNNTESISDNLVNCESDVVLIENTIGQVNEQTYMRLTKDANNKILLFGMDFAEQLNFIPKSILIYFNLICLDDICGFKKQDNYNPKHVSNGTFVSASDKKVLRSNKDAVHEISSVIGMPNIYDLFRANLLTTMDSYYKPHAMFSWLLCEVIPYMVSVGLKEEVLDLIISKEYSDKQISILQSIANR